VNDRAADLDALARVPANREVLEYLRERATPTPPGAPSPYAIDGYVVGTHPDLSDRMDEVGEHLPGGGRFVGVYGRAALVDPDGAIRVIGLGNAGLAIRVSDPVTRAEIAAHSRFVQTSLGEAWVGADPWPQDLPLAEGTARVAAWLRAAFAEPL
jgi:hypothetical protein